MANINGMAVGTSYRDDIRAFFITDLTDSAQLYDRIIKLMLVKGILVRSPYIHYHNKVEFINDTQFFAGYLTAHKRPLLATVITHLSNNIEATYIGRTLVDGLAQVTETEEVRKHLQEGFKLTSDVINTLEKVLEENHTDTPFSSDSVITDSTKSPFSDKLIMALNSALISVSIGNFGRGLATSTRSDIATEYTKLAAKFGKYALSGSKMAIKNGWLEKPPQTPDRKQLQKVTF